MYVMEAFMVILSPYLFIPIALSPIKVIGKRLSSGSHALLSPVQGKKA
jgi:hypothetical protein